MTATVTLVEIVASPPGGGEPLTIRAATAATVGLRAGQRRNFPALVSGHPSFEYGIFAPGRLDGPTAADFGTVRLNNRSGRHDALDAYVGGVWAVLAWQLDLPPGDPMFAGDLDVIEPIFAGAAGVPTRGLGAIEIPLRSPLRGFDRALEDETFPGTNAGASGNGGEPALANTVRPTTLGYCLQVPAPAANEVAKRYQVHNGPIEAIDGAYLNGEVAAHTVDLASGIYTYTVGTGSLIRSADVRGDKAGGVYRSTAGSLIAHLATTRAGIASVDADDLAAVEADRPQQVGFYAGGRATVRQAGDFLVRGAQLYYLVDPLGALRMGVLSAPAGPPAVSLRQSQLRRVSGDDDIELLRIAPHGAIVRDDPASLAEDGGMPVWRVVVRGMRHWVGSLSDDQIAAGLDDETRSDLRQEWREEASEDPAVKAAWPDAGEIVLETGLTSRVDMLAAAARELAIRKWPQQLARVSVADRYLRDAGWLIGKTISLTHPRYGLSAGVLFRVMRRVRSAGVSTLDLWRPVVS